MFEKLTKKELLNIYLDLCLSKDDGRRCELLVPYAQKYIEQIKMTHLMSVATSLDIVEKMFYKEVAKRYFNKKYIKKYLDT